MATKAETFKASEQQARQRPKAKATDGAQRPSARIPEQGEGHEKTRVASKAAHELEPHSPGTRPSRKSTRDSANRVKAASPLTVRTKNRVNTPENQHDKAAARGDRT